MNLIRDAWIPVRRRGGEQSWIAPWELTDRHDEDAVVALRSPRADFDGALAQFLIGLLQTVVAPQDHDEWIEWYETPPSAVDLRDVMDKHASAFELYGVGPCFMQDLDVEEREPKEISGLLIESPGDNTLRNNLDHFVKRGGVEALCSDCTALALFCLQTNAPTGGAGHRTSLRGGGPLTTLVIAESRPKETTLPATLWRNCWLNVLDTKMVSSQSGNSDLTGIADIFPWMGPARTSDSGRSTTPVDVHPLQMYWGMPRRISLLPPLGDRQRQCDLCGRQAAQIFTGYTTKNYGVNYEGGWRHPLSPHNIDKNGSPLPVHPQPGGLVYRHWLGLIQSSSISKLQREPAEVVQVFWTRRASDIGGQFRVWAFGYDMDNMKARCWYESTIPLYQVPALQRPSFEDNVAKLIFAAVEISGNLRVALKKAWFRRPQDKNGDTAFATVTAAFWQWTEGSFYACLAELQPILADAEAARDVRERWLGQLCEVAERLFDQWALTGPIEDSDPRRIAIARHELGRFNRCKQILEGLGLPVKHSTKQQKQKKRTPASAA